VDGLSDAARRVREGNTAAFQEIVDATSGRLVRLAARMLGTVTDAEDVVQEAYVKAYRSIVDGSFDGRSGLGTWLYRVVANASIDALRSRKRRAIPIDTLEDPGWDGAQFAEARLALVELADWLDALPPDQRAAVVLKSVEGLTTPEIAATLGCTDGAVEQRLVRARATLRQRKESHD
jgi:RNA polymerase sigma-70 factor, ECF subfamily